MGRSYAMSLELTSNLHDNVTQYQHLDPAISGLSGFEYREGTEAAGLDRLAKALVEAGVNPDKLDRRGENEKRLAIVARAMTTSSRTPSRPASSCRVRK